MTLVKCLDPIIPGVTGESLIINQIYLCLFWNKNIISGILRDNGETNFGYFQNQFIEA
jgi:hypothetical protein